MKNFLRIFLLLFSFIGYSQIIDNEDLSPELSIVDIQDLERYDEDSFLVQKIEFWFWRC